MNRAIVLLVILALFSLSCQESTRDQASSQMDLNTCEGVSINVLGVAQDAGAPQLNCKKDCCKDRWLSGDKEKVVCLGLLDRSNKESWIMEATPDLIDQWSMIVKLADLEYSPSGLFLTHAHIGHYTGLMYLGKEALGAKEFPVYAMPRMTEFLSSNGPWSQLVSDQNIKLIPLVHEREISLNENIRMTAFRVPHRDEFSETVGYKIQGPNKSALFIPDIDKWQKWEKNIIEEITKVDYAFVDATFYDGEEINNRDISEIPHPFVVESLDLFEKEEIRNKIYFIHMNHTNPLLNPDSKESQIVENAGMNVCREGMSFCL